MPRLGEAWVEISAKTAGFDEGIAKTRVNLTNAVTGMSGEFGRLESTISRIGHTMTRAFEFMAVYEGLRKVGSKIQELVDLGMEFNKTMETSRISLASSFMMNMDFKNQFGQAVSDVQALNSALGMSSKMIEKLRYDNLQTTSTFQDMVKTFSASLPAGLHLGMSPNQVEQATVRMMQVAGAQGWDMNSMGTELRELLRGQVRATSPLSSIFSLEDIKKARGDAQAMYDLIMKSTQAFALTGRLTQETFAGIYSNMKSVFSEGAGIGLKDSLYDPLKGLMSQWMTSIATVNDQTHTIDFNPDFIAKFESIGHLAMSLVNAFSQIASVGLDIAATLGEWSDVVGGVGSGLASALGVLDDMLKDATELKDVFMRIDLPVPSGGVPKAGTAGILGVIAGAMGKIPGIGGLSGTGGAGVGLGLTTGYEAMRANRQHYSFTNTAEAVVGLAGAGAIAGGLSGGTVSLGALTIPGAAVGALIGAMTALTGAIIAQTSQQKALLHTSVTAALPSHAPGAVWGETAKGAPEGLRDLYGRQWASAASNLTPEIEADINKYAAQANIPDRLLRAILGAESGFRQNDKYGNVLESQKGALGMGQLMPGTAKGLGVNPNDAGQNIEGTALYLSQLLQTFHGDMEKTIAAYNAGPGAVAKAGGVPQIPETRQYVSRVMGYMGLEGMDDTQAIHAVAKLNFKQLPEGQMNSIFTGIEDKANSLSKTMSDQMANYFITFSKNAGQSFDAAAAQIQKRMNDLSAGAWKNIEAAQKSFASGQKALDKEGISPQSVQALAEAMAAKGQKGLSQAEATLTDKDKMAPEDVKKLEAAITALFKTWSSGLQLVNFLQTDVSRQLIDQAQLLDTLKHKASMADLANQYAGMKGNYKDQIEAQIMLLEAQERAAEPGKSPQQIAGMRSVSGEQVQGLESQLGSTFEQFMGMLNDQMRNLNPNLQLAAGLFQDLNQSLDMTADSIWKMISNYNHMDTFGGGVELGRQFQMLAFNITNMFGESIMKSLMQRGEQSFLGLFGLGGGASATGGLSDLATAAEAAAQTLWGVAGASVPGAGTSGSFSSGFLPEIGGFLSHIPGIGPLFNGLIGLMGGTSAGTLAQIGATPFAAMAASDAASAAAPIAMDSAMTFAEGLSAFATGGVTSGPSLAGEAGPEAVVPLPDGRQIPVHLKGGNSGATITIHAPVNVTHNGENQQAAQAQGREIAYALQAVVKQQLHKELRPGGILNGTIRSGKT